MKGDKRMNGPVRDKQVIHKDTSTERENGTKTNGQKPKKGTFLNNISIGGKYLLVFTFSVLLFIFAIVLVYIQFSRASDNVTDIIEKNNLTNDMSRIALLIEQQHSIISDYVSSTNRQRLEDFDEVTGELLSLLDKLDTHFEGDEENQVFFQRMKDMVGKTEDVFLNKIAGENVDAKDMVYAKINISSQKNATITSVNRLVEKAFDEQEVSVQKVEESMFHSIIILLVAGSISVLLGYFNIILISRMTSRNLKTVVTTTSELAKGNLNVDRMDYRGRDEIGQIADSVNLLRENMNGIISEVIRASHSLGLSSEMLTRSSNEVKVSSNQMVKTMEELAEGAETQANSATELSEEMSQFLESVLVSQKEGQAIVSSTEDVRRVTKNGEELMSQSVEQMNRIDKIMANAVDQVKGLDEQSEEISTLVQVVKDIADQTNLLALNAAIEAARAGEHGKGFAVVADEVRKLAEQVTQSVAQITHIVSNIQSETDEVVASLGKGYEEVKEGTLQIDKTGDSFNEINLSIGNMVEGISNMANQLQEIAENSEKMNGLISDIAAVSEEAAAGIEESTASTQEASSSMDKIADNASELDVLAKVLNDQVAVFTLRDTELNLEETARDKEVMGQEEETGFDDGPEIEDEYTDSLDEELKDIEFDTGVSHEKGEEVLEWVEGNDESEVAASDEPSVDEDNLNGDENVEQK